MKRDDSEVYVEHNNLWILHIAKSNSVSVGLRFSLEIDKSYFSYKLVCYIIFKRKFWLRFSAIKWLEEYKAWRFSVLARCRKSQIIQRRKNS